MANMPDVHSSRLSKGGQWTTAYPTGDMMRLHCHEALVQNLSDGAMEDALYEIADHAPVAEYTG